MQKFKDRSNQGTGFFAFFINWISYHPSTTVFSYGMEQRLQCTDCKKVRYRVDNEDVISVTLPAVEKGKNEDGKSIHREVQLTDCLDSLLGMEALEYACPSCSKNVQALK
jgi:ubiquitin carboxyl-terminal hydrolase 5/13